MKTNISIDISPLTSNLENFRVSIYASKCSQPIKLQDSLKCNISRKKRIINVIFGMHINIEVYCKLILSFWVYVNRHAQLTQNKFTYFCNISKNAWGMKLIFCLQFSKGILRVDSMKLSVCSQVCPKYSKQQLYNIFVVSQGNREEWSLFFACR